MKITIKLAFPICVNKDSITQISLIRAPTGRDLGSFSADDFFIHQKPEVMAHVISKIAEPFIPSEALLASDAANLITISQGLSAFLVDAAGKAEINIENDSSTKA